jgi:hypothetical protein
LNAGAVAAKYRDIAYEEKIVDAMAALLVRDAGNRASLNRSKKSHRARCPANWLW